MVLVSRLTFLLVLFLVLPVHCGGYQWQVQGKEMMCGSTWSTCLRTVGRIKSSGMNMVAGSWRKGIRGDLLRNVGSNVDDSDLFLPPSEKKFPDLIGYKNTQKKVALDKEEIMNATSILMSILYVQDFQVDIWFCSEAKIRELNQEWRNVNKSTDVLSFPVNDFLSPEIFDPDDPTLQFEKHLGDIVIAPSYVKRACLKDLALKSIGKLDRSEEKGCYREMGNVFDVQGRILLLIIHGLLHLLGHDHESEKEWVVMTNREDDVLQKLRQASQLRK